MQLPRVIEALLLLLPKAIELAVRLSHESGGAQLRPVLVGKMVAHYCISVFFFWLRWFCIPLGHDSEIVGTETSGSENCNN